MFSSPTHPRERRNGQRLGELRLVAVVEADHDRLAGRQRDAAPPVRIELVERHRRPTGTLQRVHLCREQLGRERTGRETARRAGGGAITWYIRIGTVAAPGCPGPRRPPPRAGRRRAWARSADPVDARRGRGRRGAGAGVAGLRQPDRRGRSRRSQAHRRPGRRRHGACGESRAPALVPSLAPASRGPIVAAPQPPLRFVGRG